MVVGILVEKPSQLKNIAACLGAKPMTLKDAKGTYYHYQGVTLNGVEYRITNTVGHIYQYDTRQLDKMVAPNLSEKYKSWDLGYLPWNMLDFDFTKLVLTSNKRSVANNIKAVFKDADELVIMTDVDPTGEGQLLAWEVFDKLGLRGKKVSRAYFSDETDKKQVQTAVLNRVVLKPMRDDPEWKMAAYRQRFDFGSMQWTRIAKEFGDGQDPLRQGRLKSAIIRLIGEQEDKIKAYKRVPFYEVRFKDNLGNVYRSGNAVMKPSAQDLEIAKFNPSKIKLAGSTHKKSAPPKLLTLSFLSAPLEAKGYDSDEILSTYQKMYDNGYLTYPRTKDDFITPAQFEQLLPNIDAIARVVGVDPSALTYRKPRATHVKNGGVHGANRPGNKVPNHLADLQAFGPSAADMYLLLARNTLAMFAPDYEYDQQRAVLTDYPDYSATISVPKKTGWKAIYKDVTADEEEEVGTRFGQEATPFIHEGFPPRPTRPTTKWLYAELDKGIKAVQYELNPEIVKELEDLKGLLARANAEDLHLGVGTGATQVATYSDLTKDRKNKEGRIVAHALIKANKGKIELTQYGQMSYGLLPGTMIGTLELTELVYTQMAAIKAGLLSIDECLRKMSHYVSHDLKVMAENSKVMRKKLNVEVKTGMPQAERFEGTWNGKEVSIKRTWGDHRFTDEEVEDLLAGKKLKLTLISQKTNAPYSIIVRISDQLEYNGKQYTGIENLGFAPRLDAPDGFGGHTFTAEEKDQLNAGEVVYVEGLKSKAGKMYNAYLKLVDDGNGGKKLELSFD